VISGWFPLAFSENAAPVPEVPCQCPSQRRPVPTTARPQATPEFAPVIEQAKGIVMAQNRCEPDEAFDLLRRMSQHANVKVRVLATRMVEQISSPNAG
jgi:hypothetical protein